MHQFDPCDDYIPTTSQAWRRSIIPGCDNCYENIDRPYACSEFMERWRLMFGDIRRIGCELDKE